MAFEAMGHANPGDLSLTIYTEGCGESKQELINGLLCDLCDDLRDVVRIFVRRVVVELAPEAGVDDSLLQTYIVTGSEVSSFTDGTSPKLVGATPERRACVWPSGGKWQLFAVYMAVAYHG
jgi:hypothetical protein